ncbi:hypothetical protein A6U87_16565 [Rhizobium sp. AC44/96]|nr:hypothetical protein A6U87_16565 [Rhizobium sp. AC44/96]
MKPLYKGEGLFGSIEEGRSLRPIVVIWKQDDQPFNLRLPGMFPFGGAKSPAGSGAMGFQ